MNLAAELGFHENPEVRTSTCDQHGDYESRNFLRDRWTGCPACAEAARAEQAAKEEAARKAQKVAAWQARIGSAGVPERFQSRTLDCYVPTTQGQRDALKFAQDYAADFESVLKTGRSAVFVGKPGTGKTHLAIGIALAVMGRGHSAMFTTAMRALRRVKETWSRNSQETEREAIAALVFPDLLVLDEVGIQFGSDTEKLILFDVLNERYEQRKPTLLLSNLVVEEVKEYLGERVFDRLREDGGQFVAFNWASHRGMDRKTAAAGGDS